MTRISVKTSLEEELGTICSVNTSLSMEEILHQISNSLGTESRYDRLVLLANDTKVGYVQTGDDILELDVFLVEEVAAARQNQRGRQRQAVAAAAAMPVTQENDDDDDEDEDDDDEEYVETTTKAVPRQKRRARRAATAAIPASRVSQESDEDFLVETDGGAAAMPQERWGAGQATAPAAMPAEVTQEPNGEEEGGDFFVETESESEDSLSGESTLSQETPPKKVRAATAAVVSPSPPNKRKSGPPKQLVAKKTKKQRKSPLLNYDERRQLEGVMIDLDDFERYLVDVEMVSADNARTIMRQVQKLSKGEGIRYKNWASNDIVFCPREINDLGEDFHLLRQQAKAFENEHGKDLGHGWLLNHPIQKLENYQGYFYHTYYKN